MNKFNKIDLKVGYLCNNDCIHCAISHARAQLQQQGIDTELSTDQIKSMIDQYSQQYNGITLTGGEISIRKDFIELLEYASSKFEFVELQTNARKLASKDNLNHLQKLNNVTYSIALHGTTAEIHDQITQKKHSFDQTINSIKQLVALANKPTITIKFVLSNFNKHCICDMVKLTSELGCAQIDIAYVHGCTDNHDLLVKMLPSYQEIKADINKALQTGQACGVKVTLETFPLCTIDPQYYQNVDEIVLQSIDAFVHPVNDHLYDWNQDRKEFNKLKTKHCDHCFLRNNCEGPWLEYWDVYKQGQGLHAVFPDKPALPLIKSDQATKLAGYIKIFNEYY